MPAKILTNRDASLKPLHGKTCAVIGFGAQGEAQALNLRDSGVRVVVGLRPRSRSHARVRRSGLKALTLAKAAQAGDIIFLALPDLEIPSVYRREILPHLRQGKTLLFAHGFAVTYSLIELPSGVDVVLVAPKGLGPMVRSEFAEGRGVPALVAVAQDETGGAKAVALAWAKAIGCTRAGVIITTFKEETETDLFGEQAVLCGGMTALIRSAFETLVEAGYTPEVAYYECLHELKFIVDLMHERGITGMRARISTTAKFGDVTTGPRLIDEHVRSEMDRVLERIRRGTFARELMAETQSGSKRLRRLLREGEEHELERTGARLRKLMRWRR